MTDVARKECVCHRTSARNCPVHQTYVAPETVETLHRLEARGGWDEADLNDFAIVERALNRLHSLLLRAEEIERAAAEVLAEHDLWAEDANDGEFAIWRRDNFMASFVSLRRALTPEETKEAGEAT